MSKLKLPNVTLIAVGSINHTGMDQALNYSKEHIDFGDVKMITSIDCPNIDAWNKAIIYQLKDFVETDYCLLIHPDGFVVHPESWRDEWLQYDFIGSPWPLPTDTYSYRTPDGEIVRVGNSVSLRSKKILHLPSELEMAWHPYFGNTNEDGFITCHNRRLFQHFGARFAPIEVAKWFGRETDIPENKDVHSPFVFHMADVNPGRNIIYKPLVYNYY